MVDDRNKKEDDAFLSEVAALLVVVNTLDAVEDDDLITTIQLFPFSASDSSRMFLRTTCSSLGNLATSAFTNVRDKQNVQSGTGPMSLTQLLYKPETSSIYTDGNGRPLHRNCI